jgi:hypothetical protein
MLLAILGRLKDREQVAVLSKAGYRSAEAETVLGFEERALEAQKELLGRKTATPIDAYRFLEKVPLDQVAYLLAESNKSAALSKIRAYLNKWRPIRAALPTVPNELETLGMARGPKFDEIVQQVFAMQLTGRGKSPEEREKILRKLSGIKEVPKKKEKEKKPHKAGDKTPVEANAGPKHAQASATARKAAVKAIAGKHSKVVAAAHAKTGAGPKKSTARK